MKRDISDVRVLYKTYVYNVYALQIMIYVKQSLSSINFLLE